jgi:Ni/Co efflux regulator RcnB
MPKMKALTRAVAAATAVSFLIAPAAMADRGRGKGYDRGYDRHYSQSYYGYSHDRRFSRSHPYYAPPRRVVVHHPPPRFYYAPPPRTSVTLHRTYTYGPHFVSGYVPRYSVGHYYAPSAHRTVYISDYSHFGLYSPPAGYHWVRDRDRGDAILASVATGAIIGLVIGALAY